MTKISDLSHNTGFITRTKRRGIFSTRYVSMMELSA